jgi:hypothetical protein
VLLFVAQPHLRFLNEAGKAAAAVSKVQRAWAGTQCCCTCACAVLGEGGLPDVYGTQL